MSQDDKVLHVCGDRCLPSFFASLEAKLDSPLLQRAFDELKADPSAFVSVGEWANKVGVSREHLTRSISPIINPHALLQSSRVAIALTRLAQQDRLRAGEALDAMGYSSRAHAFAVFKKTTGLTPTQFWSRAQKSRQGAPATDCVVDYCPLVGAVLDRYWRSAQTGAESASDADGDSDLEEREGPRATGT
jgi:AraC-like DNA-binding protein